MDGKSKLSFEHEHSINIVNLNSGEEICHSVVMVEGLIGSVQDCETPLEITIEQITGPLCNPLHTKHKISSNMRFKCLLQLELGLNKFIVKFCSVHKEIVLYFKPRLTNFYVTPIYVICKGHDGRFQAPEYEDNSVESACERISTGVHLIQSIFAERLLKDGYGRLTFQLESDIDPMAPECHILYSDIPVDKAHTASADTLWMWLAREIMLSKLGSKERKYIAFLSSTHYNGSTEEKATLTHEKIIKSTEGYVSLGGGGLALVGTGCLHTWAPSIEEVIPRLMSNVPVDTEHFMDESNYRGTYGGCYSTTLGAAAHEMGHTFDLGHTTHGIMGPDYHNIHFMLFPEEPAVSQIPSKLISVPTAISTSSKQINNSSSEERKKEKKIIPNQIKKKETTETFFQELQVVWSMPKSQMGCKAAALLQNENINILNKVGSQQFSEKDKDGIAIGPNQSEADKVDCISPTVDSNDLSLYWPKSCISILALHKWFNPIATKENGYFNFDYAQREITSEYELGVIEIRDSESLSILNWVFARHSRPKRFIIPEQYIYPNAHVLWVIDHLGNSKAFDLKKLNQ